MKIPIINAIASAGLFRIMYIKKRSKVYFLHRVVAPTDQYYDYHVPFNHIDTAEFVKRIRYLSQYNRFISLQEYINIYNSEQPATENTILLTFDDGYRCFYDTVFPILKQYKIPAVIFLTAECIEKKIIPFHDKLFFTLIKGKHKRIQLDFNDFNYSAVLSSKNDICNAYSTISRFLKSVDYDNRTEILNQIMNDLSVSDIDIASSDQMLTWGHLKELVGSGLVSVGSHTMTHPILSKVNTERLCYEIIESKKLIENRLNCSVSTISYPNGRLIDINQQVIDLVKSNYTIGFSVIGSKNGDARFTIGRLGFDLMPRELFTLMDAGLYDPYKAYKYTPYEIHEYCKDPFHLQIEQRGNK